MRLAPVLLSIAILVAGGAASAAQAHTPAKKIAEEEIKTAINSGPEYRCADLDQIQIEHLEYFDFMGDGNLEAVVVAATCMTGTAGPDVHAVYARNSRGELVQLPVVDAKGHSDSFDRNRAPIPVFGNPNYDLTVDKGELVARWTDASDRPDPVIVRYRWDGKHFVLDHVDVKGPYRTSYDCAKATRESDRAICYSPGVAKLDLQLGQTYRRLLQQLPPDRKEELQSEQRSWLAEREKECIIYKWWVDCLTDMYAKRLAELNQGSAAGPSTHP